MNDKLAAMKKITKNIASIIIASSLAFFASCASTQTEIPAELTAQELIQKGQDRFESKDYKNALRYYNAVTERYADSLPVYVEASYEIGHIYMKQKKYEQASAVFNEIIDIYSKTSPGEAPGAYEKLSKLELAKIPQANETK